MDPLVAIGTAGEVPQQLNKGEEEEWNGRGLQGLDQGSQNASPAAQRDLRVNSHQCIHAEAASQAAYLIA